MCGDEGVDLFDEMFVRGVRKVLFFGALDDVFVEIIDFEFCVCVEIEFG